MKNSAKHAGKGILDASVECRHVLIVENGDGTFNVFEDAPEALRKYRPRRGERVSRHRAFVRRA